MLFCRPSLMEGPVFRKAFIFVMIFQGPFKKGVLNILENLCLVTIPNNVQLGNKSLCQEIVFRVAFKKCQEKLMQVNFRSTRVSRRLGGGVLQSS